MKQNALIGMIAFVLSLSILVMNAFFIVDQTENALVLQFGKMVRTIETPGLKMKIPFIQDVKFFDRQLLTYNLPVTEVNAGDQKRMVVDMYVRYRITNILMFFKNVGTKEGLQNRLAKIMPDIMQEVIGRVPLSEMLSHNRAKIMVEIQKKAQAAVQAFGIDINPHQGGDVRIIQANLPLENLAAILNRMESERRQEAKQFRAQGDEEAQKIRAEADRTRTVLLAKAEREANTLMGEGDAEAADLYGGAFGKNLKFFEFYRSMTAYLEALGEKTIFMLSPQSPFLRFMVKREE